MNLCSALNCCLKSPIGILNISYCGKGIHSIEISQGLGIAALTFEGASQKFSSDEVLTECVQWLKLYFDSEFAAVKKSLPPICPTVYASKGKFTACVWKTLASKVPPGETVSYGALAALCGNEGAGRAVGTAMATNPIPLVVPCHRVVRSDGTLGQYSGGNHIKEWLLAHEGAIQS